MLLSGCILEYSWTSNALEEGDMTLQVDEKEAFGEKYFAFHVFCLIEWNDILFCFCLVVEQILQSLLYLQYLMIIRALWKI